MFYGKRWLGIGLLACLSAPVAGWAAPAPKDKLSIRVLLLAGTPTRDYQFLRTLLTRQQEKKLVELRSLLQSAAGDKEAAPPGVLAHFPNRMEVLGDKPEDKDAALGSYDVVVAFDPDWGQLKEEQRKLLATWVKKGGALVVIAGPMYTQELVRPRIREELKTISGLYPVVLDDVRLFNRPTESPWRLHFGPVKDEMKFLKLDPTGEGKLLGWEEFFTGQKEAARGKVKPLLHGFYNCYPVRKVKPEALVLATFADPAAKRDGQEQPYLVAWAVGKGMVVYLGSGEIWRLRQCREAFHEQFWTELIRFASLGGAQLKK